MTSSVRGLFVGGKSSGNTNRQTSRRTAPVAEGQGSAAPLQEAQIQAPVLSPQAQMRVAILQAEKQDQLKNIQFPAYVRPPEPSGDMDRLAKSLGIVSTELGRLTTAGIEFEKGREERTRQHAQALAQQGYGFGAFEDFNELTRNLERIIGDDKTAGPQREQAQQLLDQLKARANRLAPYIDSQARIMRVRQNALTLSAAAARNPLVGQDEEGRDVYLSDLPADDQRYSAWYNGHIYGDVMLSPSEMREVSPTVQQAIVNDMSRQNARKVKQDEQRYTADTIARMTELGREHFAEGNEASVEEKRKAVQKIMDNPRLMGVSLEAQQTIRQQAFAAYVNGATEYSGKDGAAASGAVEVWVQVGPDGLTGVFVGPEKDRYKDGKVNPALLWVYQQEPGFAEKAESDAIRNQVNETRNARSFAQQQMEAEFLPQFEEIEDVLAQGTPESAARAKKMMDELLKKVDDYQLDGMDEAVVLYAKGKVKADLNKSFDNERNATRGNEEDALVFELQKDIIYQTKSSRDMIAIINAHVDEGRLSKKKAIQLLKQVQSKPDPATTTARDTFKGMIEPFEKRYSDKLTTRTSGQGLLPGDKAIVQADFEAAQKQYQDLERRYMIGDIDGPTLQAEAAKIQLSQRTQDLLNLGTIPPLTHSPAQIPEFRSAAQSQPDPGAVSSKLEQMNRNVQSRDAFGAMYKPSEIMLQPRALAKLFSAWKGQTNSYGWKDLKQLLEHNDIDPLDFFLDQTNVLMQRGMDLGLTSTNQELQFLQTMKEAIERERQQRPVSYQVPTQGSQVAWQQRQQQLNQSLLALTAPPQTFQSGLSGFLNSLIAGPANATVLPVEVPAPPPIVRPAAQQQWKIRQLVTGNPAAPGYPGARIYENGLAAVVHDPDGHGRENYHEHIEFSSVAERKRFEKLLATTIDPFTDRPYKITSVIRPGDKGAHGVGRAIDVAPPTTLPTDKEQEWSETFYRLTGIDPTLIR